MNILVRNLSEKMTKEKLIELFQPFGTVSSASVVIDQATGRSRGFGFIEMTDQSEGEAAIAALHHKKIGINKIRVKEANPKFGPGYFAEGNEPETELDKAVPSAEKTEKRMFKPRGEKSFGPHKTVERKKRPFPVFR